jgi:hypothetical protein
VIHKSMSEEEKQPAAADSSGAALLSPDKPRHRHNMATSYTATLTAAGLHPKLTLRINASIADSTCDLYVHVNLPPSFIVDRFELGQLHSEGRLGAYVDGEGTFEALGERDLEAPVYRAGSASLLLRVRNGKGKGRATEEDSNLEVELPLHLRYQVPVQDRWIGSERRDMLTASMDWPTVFWACRDGEREPRLIICPDADSRSLTGPPSFTNVVECPRTTLDGTYTALASTSSLHFILPSPLVPPICPPSFSLPTISVTVPTGALSDLALVEGMTFVGIWLGTLCIAWTAYRARQRHSRREKGAKAE